MNEITANTRLLLILSQLAGVGPAALKKVINIPNFLQLSIDQLASKIPPIERALKESSAWEIAQEAAEYQINESRRHDALIISALDDDYPKLLSSTKDDPVILFVKGCLAKNPNASVAIIGTRQPTIHGELIAKRITQYFAEDQWSVVSGLAIGCDSIAHRAAMDAGGHTVAVLAHGLQMIAPSQNRELATRILSSGGALVSEYPFGRAVQRQQYVKRDKTQAGMAQGVVMIQSDIVGGSLHASRASLDYHRWLAVPFPTEKDFSLKEPKVQANLLIALGDLNERKNLLKCSDEGLSSILVLKSKEDYSLMKIGKIGILEHNFKSSENHDNEVFLKVQTRDIGFDKELVLLRKNDAINKEENSKSIAIEGQQPSILSKSILQPFSSGHSKGDWLELLGNNLGVIHAVTSRLKYLGSCLERVQLNIKNISESCDDSQRQNLCFSIDDFIGQMTHATEFLVAVYFILTDPAKYHSLRAIEKLKSEKLHDSVIRGQHTHDAVISVSCEISSGLQNFKDTSADRLILASDTLSPNCLESSQSLDENQFSTGWIDEVDLRLEGLCDGFNQLVALVLFTGNDSFRPVTQRSEPAQ